MSAYDRKSFEVKRLHNLVKGIGGGIVSMTERTTIGSCQFLLNNPSTMIVNHKPQWWGLLRLKCTVYVISYSLTAYVSKDLAFYLSNSWQD